MKKAGLALLAAAALGAIAAALAWAAAGDSTAIHACVANGSNLVRIPAAGDGCRQNETAVEWNAQGPAGLPGPKGDPGPQGPTGAAGGAAAEPNARIVGFLHVDTGAATIEGESTEKGHENWITVVGFEGEASVPIAQSGGGGGTGAGKVQLKPLVITKLIDKATPKLFETLATGKTLKEVQLDLVRPDGAGGDETFYTVKLGTVLVSDEHQFDQGTPDGHALEQISFVFQKIEISEGGSTATAGGGPTT
jgi:type VI secretion system secreted protein Hcp